ncbi:MAG TPA: metallophosphoesterase [Phenylobacterium sp.]
MYAVGDVHGRADLNGALLEALVRDAEGCSESLRTIVYLGDYVDRGPSSRQVVDQLLELGRSSNLQTVTLRGNHDAQLLAFLDDPTEGATFARYGGLETLRSYGAWPGTSWPETRDALRSALPPGHLAFFQQLRSSFVCGDYFFAHAGARPGVRLDVQSDEDLMLIRGDFLSASEPFEKVVVHGHTPELDATFDGRRLGLDTGAYATGKLTAVRLRGQERDVFCAAATGRGGIDILVRPLALNST